MHLLKHHRYSRPIMQPSDSTRKKRSSGASHCGADPMIMGLAHRARHRWSQPLSPVATQHSLPSGCYSLLGPVFHRLDRTSLRLAHFAVGSRVTSRPPHRSVRAAFPHTAPTSGPDGKQSAVCVLAPVTREPGAESSACFASPHSPRSLPLAPPTPQRIAPLCSPASQLLWRGQTSRIRASSATAPHLPDADRPSHTTLTAGHEPPQLPGPSLCT